MATSSDVQVELDEVLGRCADWTQDDTAELDLLVNTIGVANNEDNMFAVEQMSLTLLEHTELPAFYKAKLYAYLSGCPGSRTLTCLSHAVFWIAAARQQHVESLGYGSSEIETWSSEIWELKRAAEQDLATEDQAFVEAERAEQDMEAEMQDGPHSSPRATTPDYPPGLDGAFEVEKPQTANDPQAHNTGGLALPIRNPAPSATGTSFLKPSTATASTGLSSVSASASLTPAAPTPRMKESYSTVSSKKGSARIKGSAYGGGYGNVEPGKIIKSKRAQERKDKRKEREERLEGIFKPE